MAVLYVKKFNLDRNGKRYKAGSFVEMPIEEATRLASSAPAEFEIITNDNTAAVSADKTPSAKSKKTSKTIDKKAPEKNDEVDKVKENAESTKVILPPVNPTDGIKKPAVKKTTTTKKTVKKNE